MKTFKKGGVHPAENKLSAGSPIREAALPKQAVFSMFQHIGAPAKPVVKKGDMVKEPSLMPEPDGSWDFDFNTKINEDTVIEWN